MAWTTPRTWTTGELVTKSVMDTHIRDNFSAVLPVGTLILRVANYATVETAVESRWLQCNGVAVSRTTYSVLFDYLNSLTPALPFGTGDGSTTFNLPDLRGRAAWAEGEQTDVDAMGDSDGTAIGVRSAKHYHNSQYGTQDIGSANNYKVVVGRDGFITNTTPTSPGAAGAAQYPLDTPAYLVVGSWFIKYTS